MCAMPSRDPEPPSGKFRECSSWYPLPHPLPHRPLPLWASPVPSPYTPRSEDLKPRPAAVGGGRGWPPFTGAQHRGLGTG